MQTPETPNCNSDSKNARHHNLNFHDNDNKAVLGFRVFTTFQSVNPIIAHSSSYKWVHTDTKTDGRQETPTPTQRTHTHTHAHTRTQHTHTHNTQTHRRHASNKMKKTQSLGQPFEIARKLKTVDQGLPNNPQKSKPRRCVGGEGGEGRERERRRRRLRWRWRWRWRWRRRRRCGSGWVGGVGERREREGERRGVGAIDSATTRL